jgi:outer membrane protein assembly factor BamB
MRRFLGAGLMALFLTYTVFGQLDRTGLHTTPVPPPREALDRLNLKLAWSTHIQMDGKKDGIVNMRLTGKHLLIQTRSGLVTQIEAETGRHDWRNRVGNPYQILQPLTYNSSSVFVLNNNYLYGLDRKDGDIRFQMTLPGGISAPPKADEEQIYLPTVQGRLRTYRLPTAEMEKEIRAAKAAADAQRDRAESESSKPAGPYDQPKIIQKAPGDVVKIGIQPYQVWAGTTNIRLDFQPLLGGDVVALASSNGTLIAFRKYPSEEGGTSSLYRFQAEGDLLAAPGQYEDTVYLGSIDANLYAVDMVTGRVLWRHTAGSAIYRKPFATRDDLYVSSERNGLSRLNRETGESLWSITRGKRQLVSQPDLDRVLAVNRKFVYATDRSGRLVVVDRIRGTILSTYDIRDFVVLTPNEWSDRLYLAAQNGLVICLHDREHVLPFDHRKLETPLGHKLKRLVTLPAATDRPLGEVVNDLANQSQMKIFLSVAAFKKEGIDMIDLRKVSHPAIDGVSVRDALKILLDPVNAIVEQAGDILLIIPKPPDKKEKPPEKEKEKDN